MDDEWLFLTLRLLALLCSFSSSFSSFLSSSLSLSSSPLSSSEVALSSNERAGWLELACCCCWTLGSGASIQKKHLDASPEKRELVQHPSGGGFLIFWLIGFTIVGLNAPFTVLGRFSPRATAPVERDSGVKDLPAHRWSCPLKSSLSPSACASGPWPAP